MRTRMILIPLFLVAGLLLAAIVVAMSGCAIAPAGPGVCDTVPEDSYSVVCLAAEQMNTTPEQVAAILELANVSALAADVYTARQADAFIDEVRGFLQATREAGGITYEAAVRAALARHATLAPEVQALFIILDGTVRIDAPQVRAMSLSDYDYGLLLGHMARQKALIAPFLEASK